MKNSTAKKIIKEKKNKKKWFNSAKGIFTAEISSKPCLQEGLNDFYSFSTNPNQDWTTWFNFVAMADDVQENERNENKW